MSKWDDQKWQEIIGAGSDIKDIFSAMVMDARKRVGGASIDPDFQLEDDD
jgi:hypothetical protein